MTNSRKLQVGDSVKIISNFSSHNKPIGTMVTISRLDTGTSLYVSGAGYNEFSVYVRDIEKVPQDKKGIEAEIKVIKKNIEERKKEVKELENQLSYLDETNQTEFDQTKYKVYKVLQLIKESEKSDLEKAELIASLIKL